MCRWPVSRAPQSPGLLRPAGGPPEARRACPPAHDPLLCCLRSGPGFSHGGVSTSGASSLPQAWHCLCGFLPAFSSFPLQGLYGSFLLAFLSPQKGAGWLGKRRSRLPPSPWSGEWEGAIRGQGERLLGAVYSTHAGEPPPLATPESRTD